MPPDQSHGPGRGYFSSREQVRLWRFDLLSWERATSSMTKTDTDFAYRIDRWDTHGHNIIQHIANVDDLVLAMAAYEAARKHWPGETITLREGSRVIKDTRVALPDSRKWAPRL
jgi:hypothetical protein